VKLKIVRNCNNLVGLYWLGAGINELSLNITRKFGVRLKFKSTAAQDDRVVRSLLESSQEKARLEGLSNEALVAEVMSCEVGDCELVIEMCDRLHPGWYEEA